ncbi:MAG: MATE family efflux transporter [Lachnospiraceae bacterium]|nr:MATE family efflux transporter [Lachnospiraceae bacterium]
MKNTVFTEGKILSPLVRFVFPIIFSMFLQSLYGAVDLLVVGQFSDAADVSAVSIGSQLMQSITFVITDMALGTTVLLGQMIGQNRLRDGGKVIGTSIALFLSMGALVAVSMQFLSPAAAGIMHTPAEAFSQATAYLRICCGGAVFIVAYNILGSIFRGMGNSRMPLITVAIAAVFNIFGDLYFVAVLGMGAAGAAAATVMSQGLSVLISLLIIRKSGLPFDFSVKDIRYDLRVIRRILTIGVPIALQDLLVSISFLVILAIVNGLGVIASAGIGVAEKLCGFIMLVPSAFSQSISSFVAQNFGAGRMDRARKALYYGIGISLCCGVLIGYAAYFHGGLLSGIFTSDMEVRQASADYLRAYAIDCLMTAFLFCFIGYFNGCQRTAFVMLQGITGAFLVRVPLSMLFSRIQPVSLFRIGLATPCSSLVQNLLCLAYLLKMQREKR